MKRQNEIPIALTIAGSDSGGGAGIQADLKTFAALSVHGVTVLTCVTAQNPRRLLKVQPCTVATIHSQFRAVFEALRPAAAKTGMLYSSAIIGQVADWLRQHPLPLVVDPVMVSTSGAGLLAPRALEVLRRQLLPLAALITPNLNEAEVLTRSRIRSVEDLRRAAKRLVQQFGTAVLVKGGHLRGLKQAVDIFYDGSEELLLSAPFVRGVRTHGTGCTYSAAITACLASGLPLPQSVAKAKQFVTRAIASSQTAAGQSILNSFWRRHKG